MPLGTLYPADVTVDAVFVDNIAVALPSVAVACQLMRLSKPETVPTAGTCCIALPVKVILEGEVQWTPGNVDESPTAGLGMPREIADVKLSVEGLGADMTHVLLMKAEKFIA